MAVYQRRANRIIGHVVHSENGVTANSTSAYPSGMLKGQVAIITGSGQGIGESCAKLFAKEGAKVVVTDIDKNKSDKVAGDIVAAGGEAISVPGDVCDPKFPELIVNKTIEKWGKINHIVNNAGYTWDGMLHKMTDKQWQAMLEVHNTAPFRLVRAAAPYMREKAKEEKDKGLTPESRSIVNVSSTSGLHGNVGQANYATAKAGIEGFTKTIAKEWGPLGIRCNTVAFGWIDTRLTRERQSESVMVVDGQKVALGMPKGTGRDPASIPLGRGGEAHEAAGGVLFLCSPFASYVNGHTLQITGGFGI
eukprot:TRINITY_DN8181_c0_g1_i1.p1 TRINITY_DN8181_c0_g1~~TRINITY_DN8181_c0_g1_i1.p1  ORF type:complete len:306 (+),score=80.07 TRINITY_DN8181_c0_g1_i1:44-961(+)